MRNLKSLFAGAALSVMSSSVWAVGDIDVGNLTSIPETFDAFNEDMTAAFSYKAISPGEPLGLLGFDIGAELSVTSLEKSDEWGAAIGDVGLAAIPVPRLHLHKGLPFDIDLGVSYLSVANVKVIGGELRYSFLGGNVALPAVGLRGTFSQVSGVDNWSFNSKGLELTVSKGFLMLTPYASIGQIWGTSSSDLEVAGVPVFDDAEASVFKWSAGLNLNLGLFNMAFETDQTGDNTTYSMKAGLRF